mmetsp:Transcript_10238/g.16686  ORF Transcript_10238/g.16686 Transcript_10238/m.16686 type:complete len:406 (-) Transcript_10238:936-2153(-)
MCQLVQSARAAIAVPSMMLSHFTRARCRAARVQRSTLRTVVLAATIGRATAQIFALALLLVLAGGAHQQQPIQKHPTHRALLLRPNRHHVALRVPVQSLQPRLALDADRLPQTSLVVDTQLMMICRHMRANHHLGHRTEVPHSLVGTTGRRDKDPAVPRQEQELQQRQSVHHHRHHHHRLSVLLPHNPLQPKAWHLPLQSPLQYFQANAGGLVRHPLPARLPQLQALLSPPRHLSPRPKAARKSTSRRNQQRQKDPSLEVAATIAKKKRRRGRPKHGATATLRQQQKMHTKRRLRRSSLRRPILLLTFTPPRAGLQVRRRSAINHRRILQWTRLPALRRASLHLPRHWDKSHRLRRHHQQRQGAADAQRLQDSQPGGQGRRSRSLDLLLRGHLENSPASRKVMLR